MAFCAGYCIGPQTFYAASAPDYSPGLYFCCGCFFVAEVTILTWYIWVRLENRRRDKKAQEMGITLEQQNLEGCLFGLQDMTDIQVTGPGGRRPEILRCNSLTDAEPPFPLPLLERFRSAALEKGLGVVPSSLKVYCESIQQLGAIT